MLLAVVCLTILSCPQLSNGESQFLRWCALIVLILLAEGSCNITWAAKHNIPCIYILSPLPELVEAKGRQNILVRSI
jgi:hypothetical protein